MKEFYKNRAASRKILFKAIFYLLSCLIIAGSAVAQNKTSAQTEGDLQEDSKKDAVARIVVNVPAYKLQFYQGDRLVKTFPVAIGSPQFSSPYGVVKEAVELVWNPRWTPPDSDWAKGEKPAAPGAADNPLGKLKIRMANFPFLIHGGGDKSINKAVSHGCVRMRNADVLELAKLVIDASSIPVTDKQIARFQADRYHEHGVKITEKIIVEFHYDTITYEDGHLNIYPDIYKEGTNTVDNLTYVLYKAGIRFKDLSPDIQSDLIKAVENRSKQKLELQVAAL